MNITELDQYSLADAVKFHNRLNPKLWGADEKLLPEVRSKLLEIAADFQEFLGVSDLDVKDITLSGSNAAYSYTPHSDIDLHLVVDVPQDEVYQELFNAKKYQYNDMHDIRIRGADVELYVQPAGESPVSLGEYSIKDDAWIEVPKRKRARIDQSLVRHKYEDLRARIESALKENDSERVQALATKIKAMRQAGLDQHGEFGPENLAYKILRKQGLITRLYDHMAATRDRELSLKEQPRQPVRYGFSEGHQGQPYSSEDGVAPSTQMFLNETDEDEKQLHEFISYAADQLGIERMPEIVLHRDDDWGVENHSFGRYEPETHTLHVNLAGRHLMDIFRTTAHELAHCRQHELDPLPDSAGETGSPWENQAHATAGVIMRHWADRHPEMFDSDTLEEATGYIPKNRREAHDPRFSMAITGDIKPGEVGRQANKLALHTGRNGEPGLLMKTANLIKEAFDQPYALTWEQGDFGDWSASAKLPDGNYIEILFTRTDRVHQYWYVEFYRNHSQDVTGEGDAMRVFATVMQAIRKFVKKIKPPLVKLAATKDVEPGIKPESRARLYQRMAQRFAAAMGYQVQVQDRGIQVNFEFTRQTPVAEGFSNDMSTEDMIAYLRQHHDKNLHPDYLNHLTSTNSKFVLKNIPINSIKTELSGLDRSKVEQYKKMDFSKAPPIVVGSDGNILDGYHRATVAKALGIPAIKAYVGVKGQPGVAEDTEHNNDQVDYQGLKIKFKAGADYAVVDAYDATGSKRVGQVVFDVLGDHELEAQDLHVGVKYRGQGVARAMYDFVKARGYTIRRSYDQTDAGAGFWDKHRGEDTRVWEEQDDLAESLRREFEILESEYITEISMRPANLRQEAARTGAIAGMEFEMIVPNVANPDADYDSEPDYDMNESVRGIEDACQFFYDGDVNSRRDIANLREEMNQQYEEWYDDRQREKWDEESSDYIRDWLWRTYEDDWKEEARSELGDEASDEQIEEFVTEKWDSTTEDVMANMGSDWDQAYDEWSEDFRANNDLEDEWLQDQGWETMLDIRDNFDINWPHYYTPEPDGADISSVADDFSDAVGMPVNASSSYHGGRREAGHYVVEPDGSLEPDDSDDTGLEFVSPPMPIDQLLDQLKKVKAWAGRYGCYTNESTGLHINISVPDYDLAKLDYVKLALMMGDEYVLDQFGRSSNTYAKSAMSKIRDILRTNPDAAKQVLDKMKGHMDDLATKAIHSGVTNKYTSINTKDGYIEFRSPGGDWLDENFDKIETTLLRFTVALSAAMDPAAYREEYLKKLYKLLSPRGEEDPIAYFARYSAGQLPKSALSSFVRQVQLQRRIKRGQTGDKPMWWNVSWGNGRVEVVAKSQQEAIDTAFQESYWAPDQPNTPEAQRFRASLRATPLRPYDQSPVQAQVGEPESIGQRSGPTLGDRPSNPDGNYVITPEGDRHSVYYRFQAVDIDDANTVLRQWRQQYPNQVWVAQRDDHRMLGQPPIPGSTLDLQRQRSDPYRSVPIPGVTDVELDVPLAEPRPLSIGREHLGWSVRLPSGEEVTQIRGIGNNQGDANRIAADWLRRNGYGVSGEGFEVVPLWGEA